MAALSAPEPIGPGHDATGFACGMPPIEAWLRQEAHRAPTFVVHDTGRITGFYALAPGTVHERRAVAGLRSDGSLPILKLGRLAVDKPAQRSGLGTALVLDAFARCYAVSRHAPIAALLADPPEAAAGWLRGLGFLPVPGDASAHFVALGTMEALLERA